MRLHSSHGPPCKHMEGFLNREADGSARGLARWYALAHAVRCTRCRKYLDALKAMIGKMREERVRLFTPEMEQRLAGAVAMASAQID